MVTSIKEAFNAVFGCDCEECLAAERPCFCDCSLPDLCLGCRSAREEQAEADHEKARALGR